MDALKKLFSLFFFTLLVSCAKEKDPVETKFPETTLSCFSTAHETRYLVKKTDGTISEVYANSREEMKENYVIPNIEKISFVESDQALYLENIIPNDILPMNAETWGPQDVKAQEAWALGFKGQNVLVAVIDSGTDTNHTSLKDNIYTNLSEKNGLPNVDDDNNGLIDDVSGYNFSNNSPHNIDEVGHGTHVAGIISSKNSNQPFLSIAPESKILPIDFMSGSGGFTSDAIKSIDYAISMKSQVINASWGSSGCSKLLNEKIDDVSRKNVLFVAAAGNSGNDISLRPEYPAAYKSALVITVGAITQRGFLASFSNYGNLVDVAAPGAAILSAYKNNSYSYLDGTSMAAPMVSGLAALLLSKNQNLTSLEIKNIIESSVAREQFLNIRTQGKISAINALNLVP